MMLVFDLFDSAPKGLNTVAINPMYVESVVILERVLDGVLYKIASVSMYSGDVHVVWDNNRQVVAEITAGQNYSVKTKENDV